MNLFTRLRLSFLVLFTNRTVVNVRDPRTGRFINIESKPKIRRALDRLLKLSIISSIPNNFSLSDVDNILKYSKSSKQMTVFVPDDSYRTINRYFIRTGIGNLSTECDIYRHKSTIRTLCMMLEYGKGSVQFILLDILDHRKLDKNYSFKKGQCLLVNPANQRSFFEELYHLQKVLK